MLNDQLTVFLTESTFRSSPNDSVKSLRSSTTAQAESKSDLANSASGKSGKSVLSQSLESDDAIHSAADGKSNKLRVASRESKMRNRPSRRSKQILEFRQLKQEVCSFFLILSVFCFLFFFFFFFCYWNYLLICLFVYLIG